MADCFTFLRKYRPSGRAKRRNLNLGRIRKSEIFIKTKSGVFTNALAVKYNEPSPRSLICTESEQDDEEYETEYDEVNIADNYEIIGRVDYEIIKEIDETKENEEVEADYNEVNNQGKTAAVNEVNETVCDDIYSKVNKVHVNETQNSNTEHDINLNVDEELSTEYENVGVQSEGKANIEMGFHERLKIMAFWAI